MFTQLIELTQHYDISIKIEALYVSSKYSKFSGELQLQATNEVVKLFHKDKDEAHEPISVYFPALLSLIQQNTCLDVWNDITKVFKELIAHPNKLIAARAMEHTPIYIKYGVSNKLLDESSVTELLEWLSKLSYSFLVNLYNVFD
jgi:hypothetical protein